MAYGMRPHKVAGAGYFNGGFEEFPIDISAQTTNIWQGDVVALSATGEAVREGSTPSNSNPVLGVFTGCRYTDPDGEIKYSNKYVGNASNTDAYAMVVTDTNMTFTIQSDTAWDVAQRGLGAILTIANGSNATGLSGNNLVITTGADSAALRIIGVVEDGSNELSTTSNPNVIVKWMTPDVLVYNDATSI